MGRTCSSFRTTPPCLRPWIKLSAPSRSSEERHLLSITRYNYLLSVATCFCTFKNTLFNTRKLFISIKLNLQFFPSAVTFWGCWSHSRTSSTFLSFIKLFSHPIHLKWAPVYCLGQDLILFLFFPPGRPLIKPALPFPGGQPRRLRKVTLPDTVTATRCATSRRTEVSGELRTRVGKLVSQDY